jgi:LmbE family N-acetylglucosaminyl deacetylase
MDFDPHSAIDYIYKQAPEYGKAKGRVAELEAYKSSLKAILMKQSNETAIGAQEREAYAHPDYQNLCKAIGEATEQAEIYKWRLESAKMRFEAWRTEQASNRQIEKLTR